MYIDHILFKMHVVNHSLQFFWAYAWDIARTFQANQVAFSLFINLDTMNGATCLLFRVYACCGVQRWQQCTVMVCFDRNCLVHLEQIKLGWRSTSAWERRLKLPAPNQSSMCTLYVTQFRTCCPADFQDNYTTEFVCVLCTLPVCASGQLEA